MDGFRAKAPELMEFAAVQNAEGAFPELMFFQIDFNAVGSLPDKENFYIIMPVLFYKEMVRIPGSGAGGKVQSLEGDAPKCRGLLFL